MNTAREIWSASRTRNRALAWTGSLCWLFLGAQFQGSATANQVLLFAETLGTSRYQTALDNRGYKYQLFTDETAFNQAVQNADPASDAAVVDAMANFHTFGSLPTFVSSGGRALLQYWNLTAGSTLATAFQVTVIQQLAAPLPTYDWGGSSLFTGLNSPLILVESGFNTDVLKLQPTAGGQAIAGFVGSPTVNQAGLVLGQSGRTLVQGFFIEDVESTDDAVRLAQNELDYLFGPLAPANGPAIIADPQSQTVLTGGSVTLRAAVSGSLPLDYQWRKGGTNILGATNDTYSVSNALPQQAGGYTLVVTNPYGSITSGVATLTVADPEPVSNVLLFVDGSLASPYQMALLDLNLPYQQSTDDGVFDSAVAAASPANTLAIVDSTFYAHRFSALTSFVQAGGRAILQYWSLSAGSRLTAAFGVSVAQPNTSSSPLYEWNAPDLFAGVGSPIAFTSLFNVHGQKLQPLTGAQAMAGYSSSPAPNQAALVIGNSGRTLVNAFILEEAAISSQADRLAHNEVVSFFPLQINSISVSNASVTLSWITLPGSNYQVQLRTNLQATNWLNVGSPITASDTTASLTDAAVVPQCFYRVVLVP